MGDEATAGDVDDPILGDRGAGVEGGIEGKVEAEGGDGDLHQEAKVFGPRGVSPNVSERPLKSHEIGFRFISGIISARNVDRRLGLYKVEPIDPIEPMKQQLQRESVRELYSLCRSTPLRLIQDFHNRASPRC